MPIFFHFTMDRMYTCCTFTSEIRIIIIIIIINIAFNSHIQMMDSILICRLTSPHLHCIGPMYMTQCTSVSFRLHDVMCMHISSVGIEYSCVMSVM